MSQYLLCIGYTHDVEFGREREREGKFLVIPTVLQCLQGVTKGTLSDTKRSISNQHHLWDKRRRYINIQTMNGNR